MTIWKLDVSSYSDLHVNSSRDLRLSIDVDRINTSQSSDLSSFGVVPVLDLQADKASWTVRQAKGKIQGVSVNVSGLGAYARVQGAMSFSTIALETSKTYQEMKKTYGFSAGISGFWNWIGFGTNASTYKQALTQVFDELSQAEKMSGRINVDLYVTGIYPNVSVSAEAYILALELSSKTDSTFKIPVISTGAPAQDTGAQDQNGHTVPTKDNNSTIDI